MQTKIHLAHTPTRKQIDITKRTGNTNEVAPHHLFLSTKDQEQLGQIIRCSPSPTN